MKDAMARLLAAQYGVATPAQLEAAGVPRWKQRTLIRQGTLVPTTHGLQALAGTAPTWHQQAMVATVGTHPQAALSHGTAARLLAMDGFDRYRAMHVIVQHGLRPSSPPPGVIVHQTRRWEPEDGTDVDGIRVRIAPLTLIDVYTGYGVRAASRALDSVLRQGTEIDQIQHVIAGRVARGRRGPTPLLRLLDEKTNRRLPRSWFQRIAARLLAESGIRCEDEYPVHNAQGVLLAELDLAMPELKIGIECQSWRWHSTPTARAWDAARKRQLRRAGWEIVEVWWADLRRMEEVVATIRVVIKDRRPILDV